MPNFAAESVAQGKNMSATKQCGCSSCNTCSSGSLRSRVAFMNLMNLSGASADSVFSQPSGRPESSVEGNLMVLMLMLAFPMVLEM